MQAVRSRAARFQGHLPTSHIEDLQVTKYQAGQQYTPHLDPVSGDDGTDRVTTIFAILADSCDGGGGRCGTQFPEVLIDWAAEDPRWCEVVDCAEKALTIRPRAGNAVFWRNRRDDGSIHPKALHAGLPIQGGVKVGLNIWTDGEPRWGDADM